MDGGEILKAAATQGIWALLFVSLLLYVLKESARREEKLIETNDKTLNALNELSKQYGNLNSSVTLVSDTVSEIQKDVIEMKVKS